MACSGFLVFRLAYVLRHERLFFPLPVLPDSLRRVRLTVRQENASRQASPCLFVATQPFDA